MCISVSVCISIMSNAPKKLEYDKRSRVKLSKSALNSEFFLRSIRGCPRGVMVKAMDCGILVTEFVLQSSY